VNTRAGGTARGLAQAPGECYRWISMAAAERQAQYPAQLVRDLCGERGDAAALQVPVPGAGHPG